MRKDSFYGQLSVTEENIEDLKIWGTTQCMWGGGRAYVLKSPHQRYIHLRTTINSKSNQVISKSKVIIGQKYCICIPQRLMCKQKYRCSFKYYITQGLLLLVHLIIIFVPLIFALGSQCILVCSYEMFLEKKWMCDHKTWWTIL